MRSTRRQFLVSASAFALATSIGGLAISGLGSTAWAQTVAQAELMQPGPLGEQVLGADNAPVTIVEYASMTCPHCATFHLDTYPALKERYIDTGKVRFIFREFPLDPLAAGASMLARCAGKDKYFPVVELLFQTQRQWAVERPLQPLLKVVRQAGFTEDSFKACLANQQMLDGVQWVRDRAAEKFNVSSTPTFFINGQVYKGAMSIEEMDKAIQPYLKS